MPSIKIIHASQADVYCYFCGFEVQVSPFYFVSVACLCVLHSLTGSHIDWLHFGSQWTVFGLQPGCAFICSTSHFSYRRRKVCGPLLLHPPPAPLSCSGNCIWSTLLSARFRPRLEILNLAMINWDSFWFLLVVGLHVWSARIRC